MEFTNLLSDENSLKDDYLSENNLKVNKMEDIIKEKELKDKIIYSEEFEKNFNKVFYPKTIEINEDYEEKEENSPPFIIEKIKNKSNIKLIPEKKIIIIRKVKKDKYFPFTQGLGLAQTLKSIGLSSNYIFLSKENLSLNNYNNQNYISSKFKITDYYIDEKGKKRKQKKRRKFKPDDIRKKIKSRFHKVIKNIINTNLKKAGAKKLFDLFPQSFIRNVSIKLNSESFGLTFEKLIKYDFISDNDKKSENPDIKKYKNNLEVLKYLNENPGLSIISDFEKIKNMKYVDLLKAYFSSLEFEQALVELYHKKEKIEYIEEYINKSISYINFFSLNKKKINDSTFNNNCIKINYNEESEKVNCE